MTRRLLAVLLAAACAAPLGAASDEPVYYRPKLRPGRTLEPFLPYISAGNDADLVKVAGNLLPVSFPDEKEAEDLTARLQSFSQALRRGPAHVEAALEGLLAADFKGGKLTATADVALGTPAFEVWKAKALPTAPTLDRTAFTGEWRALLADLDTIRTAEFLITRIDVTREAAPVARTRVRYDVVGTGHNAWRAERVGTWTMTWHRAADGSWRVAAWTAEDDVRSRAKAPVFSDVTESALGATDSYRRQLRAGLDDWLARIDSTFTRDSMGHHGVAVADVDGDGLEDFYITQPEGLPNRLFRNKGDGTFEDVTPKAGLPVLDDTSHALFLDVENDGDPDLVLVSGSGLLLFANDGKGIFSYVPGAFRIKNLRGTTMSLAAADYDRDGFVDLYVCTYSYFIGAGEDKGAPTPYVDAENGPPALLLHNDGRGHFDDVTAESGLDNNNRFHFAAAWADYDGDGWPDLAVANDFGRKNLYHNEGMTNGRVTFKDVAAAAGAEDHGAGMSATWIDYDNDGKLDLYFGNMWSAPGQRIMFSPSLLPDAPEKTRALFRKHVLGNSLLKNRGDGTFEDVSLRAGADFGRWAWSSDAIDFDSDGWEDLYVATGMFTRKAYEEDLDGFMWRQIVARSPLTKVTGTPYEDAWRAINRLLADHSQANHQRNVFLRNDGHGAFQDVSGTVGLDLDQDGRSFAAIDYDQDGDPDMVVMAARATPQIHVFRNDLAQANASLALHLTGTRSNRDAIGATVTVTTDAMHRTRLLQANSGFISQNSRELLFGLGTSARVISVEIVWPSGARKALSDVPINRRVWIEEGKGLTRTEAFRAKSTPPTTPPPALPPVELPNETWLYQPFLAPDFKLADVSGQPHSLSDLGGKPAVLLFWSTSAPASRTALQALSRERSALAAAGVGVLTVALDTPADAAKIRAAAAGVTVPVLVGDQDTGNKYAILNHHLFVAKEELHLPTLFLMNADGEIVKVYRDHITSLSSVLADVPRMAAPQAERVARALPFPGEIYLATGERTYLQFAIELVEQGYEQVALPVFERAVKEDQSAFTWFSLGTLYMKNGAVEKAVAAFRKALDVKPDLAEASNGLGALLAQNGNVPAAIELFRRALAAEPEFPDAMNNLGYALLQTGREEEAYGLYQKALALQPDFPEALNNLGIYFGRQGDLPQAESYFKRAVEKRPGYGEAANNYALVLMNRDAVEPAIDMLKKTIAANPEFLRSYLALAQIYLGVGRPREAAPVLEQLLQRDPKNQQALELAAHLRAQ